MFVESITAALPDLQAYAESLMVETCTIRRPTGTTADPATGADVTTYAGTNPYAGPCKVQAQNLVVSAPEVATGTATVQRYEIHVPVSAGPFAIGDVVLVGSRSFRVTGLHDKTWQTAQRLPVEEMP